MNVVWQYFKPFARGMIGIATILGGCFTAGWGGAWGLQKIFDTQLARAELRMDQKLINSETKVIGLHLSEINTINGKLDVLIGLTNSIVSQRTPYRKDDDHP